MPPRNAKAGLRNSWKPTAEKAGRFCDHQITKSCGPAREIIRFHVMCRMCPAFLAGGFLEFLRSVSAHQNGMCALGRIAAIPSFRVPPTHLLLCIPLPTYDDLLKGEFRKFDDCFSTLFFCFQNPGLRIYHFDLSNRLCDLKGSSA